MRYRIRMAATALCALAAASPARAQIASTSPMQDGAPGWSFAVAPYAWLPTISTNFQASNPLGGTVSGKTSADIGDYLGEVNFATMIGGVARYDRFSVMTDLIYFNASLTSSTTHLSTVNLGSGPIDIPRSEQFGTGTRAASTIWSLAGGYTLLQGDWGNVDAVAGMRMLATNSTTNYQLNADILGPNRTIALTRGGSLKVNKSYFSGIGGATGRINIPNSSFYLPFYFDAGGGGVPFTWQAYVGVAYQAASWADLSVGYRYLTFEGGSTGVKNLSLSGILFAANLHF